MASISNIELRIGQVLNVPTTHYDVVEKNRDVEEMKVIGLYTYHVLLQNKKGIRISIPNNELYRLGILSGQYKVETPSRFFD